MNHPHPITKANQEDSNQIRRRLIEYNAQHVADDLKSVYEEINLTVKADNGNIIGGMLAVLCWNWIEVDILWVDAAFRGSGYGSKLMKQIEAIAIEKRCSFIKLNTFSFQAPDFYLKNGYSVYAVLENAPRGCKHYYLKKDLSE